METQILKRRFLCYLFLLLCAQICLSASLHAADDPRAQILAFYRQLDRSACASASDPVRLTYRQVTRMTDLRYPVSTEDVTMVLHADYNWVESAHTSMLMDKDVAFMIVPRKETVFLRPLRAAEKRVADSFALHEDLLQKARFVSRSETDGLLAVEFAPAPGVMKATGITAMRYTLDLKQGQLRQIRLSYAEATGIRDITVDITDFNAAYAEAVRPPALKDLTVADVRPLLPEAYRNYRIKDMRMATSSSVH